jgi:hypothetical protein
MTRTSTSRISAALLCLLLACGQLFSTTIVPMSVERLTRASTNVVLAKATDSWTEWNPEHSLIYTVTRFRVERSIKGTAQQEIVVKQIGGQSGAYQQKVAGVRHFQSGERSVLFVHPSESKDGRYVVTGLMQGNFLVKTEAADPVVTNGIEGVESFDPNTKETKVFRGAAMRLSQLESRVKKAAQQ